MNKNNKKVVDGSNAENNVVNNPSDYPLEKKLCLTLAEASIYSGISEQGIRAMTQSPDCNFVLYPEKRGRGCRILIHRESFERYIASMTTHFGTEVTK